MNIHRFARVISYILHPLLLPTLAFVVLLYGTPSPVLSINSGGKWRLLLIVFVLTCLAPITSILIFYTTGSIQSLRMNHTSDRQIPFSITTVFYLMATFLFSYGTFREFPLLAIITGSISFMLAAVTIITFYWKISAHSVGISGLVGFMIGLSYRFSGEMLMYPLVIAILLAGLLMSARLYLNAHTPQQVYAGCLLGFTVSLLAVILFL